MSTDHELNHNESNKEQYARFRLLRTYPKKWDFSVFSLFSSVSSDKKHAVEEEKSLPLEPASASSEQDQHPKVSFSDFHLGPHFDQYEDPNETTFTAY